MLRRNADKLLEFLQLEQVLAAAAPPGLSNERREALRLRIFSQLEEQAPAPSGLRFLPPRERWVVLPAGAGLAAAVIAGAMLLTEQVTPSPDSGITAHVVGDVLVDGQQSSEVQPGAMLVAQSSAWVSVGPGIRVGLERGAVVRYDYVNGSVAVHLFAGEVTVATTKAGVNLNGEGWGAILGEGTLVSAATKEGQTRFTVEEGSAALTVAGATRTIDAHDAPVNIGVAPAPGASPVALGGAVETKTGSTPSDRASGSSVPGEPPGASPMGVQPGASASGGKGQAGSNGPAESNTGLVSPAGGAGEGESRPGVGGASSDAPGAIVRTPPGQLIGAGPENPDEGSSPAPGPAGAAGGELNGGVGAIPTASAGSPVATGPTGDPHTATDPAGNPHTASDPTGNPHTSGGTGPASTPAAGSAGSAPGNSGNAQGHNQGHNTDGAAPAASPAPQATVPADPAGAPGNPGNAPGHNKDDASAAPPSPSGNSGKAPGHNKP